MRSDTRLDTAVFQLTPTRTRCDLVIIANGKTEKIASGLLNPFLSHLRTAQDQIAIGGYSIKLEPDPGAEAAWFTKGTVERFVRFVSTPEVLERVITIESEITQIDKAISFQGNDNHGLSTVEELHQMKSIGSTEGNKLTSDANAEKALILFKPGSHPNPPESNGSKIHEENSKVQLLRVLESRKKVLQKEQAMAFARTAAASFDIESMTYLISFAESFGASRLIEACTRYMQLWKGKHETGQWIEVEAAEALSYRSEFSPLNSSGVILSGDPMRQKELAEMWPISGIDTCVESNGNTTSQDNDKDKRFPSEPQAPRGLHEHYQGQVQHPAFPQWPILSQPGPHGFHPYPMQAMPYYQNYPMNGQFFQPPPTPMEDPRLKTKRKAKKKHSINNKDSTFALEDESDESTSEYEEESSKSRSSHQKAGHSKKKKGVVVIKNLNYIAGKRHDTSKNGSESPNDSEIEENKDSLSENGGSKQKSLKPSKKRDDHLNSFDISNGHERNDDIYSQEADAGNWQAFQNFLLRAEEKMTSVVNEEILAGEKEPPVKKGQNKSGPDPLFLPERYSSSYPEESIMEYDVISGKRNRIKQVVLADDVLISISDRGMQAKQIATHFKEIDGGVRYRKGRSDDFIKHGREKQVGSKISSNHLVDCVYEHDENFEKGSSHNVKDESFMIPFRLGSQDLLGVDRRLTVDMDSNCPSISQRNEDFLKKKTTRFTHEPNDLTFMLGRRRESESAGYGPAIDYDIQVPFVVKNESKKKNDISASTNQGLMKTVRERKLNSSQGGLEKKRKDAMMTKMASSRFSSLTEAQKRAGKLRSFKSDLQKVKKEHEEEEMKRLEALKRERQKRIAARSSSNPAQSPATLQQHKPRLPVKVTHSTYKSSKFTDSNPGPNLHLQRFSRNISSNGTNGSEKVSKTTRSNRFNRLASSFPEFNKECVKPEERSVSERIRRLPEPKGKEGTTQEGSSTSERIRKLSEPKGSIVRNVSGKSAKNITQVMKKPSPEVQPQSKKISAIIQLDRTKSETLPELKIKTYKTPSEAVKNKTTTKQQKGVGSRSSLISAKKIEKTPSFCYSDENPVVEKTVVMLENEVVSTPPVQTSEGKIGSVDKSYMDVRRNKNGVDAGYNSIRALPSPVYGVKVDNSTECGQNNRLNSYEIANYVPKDESESFFVRTVPEKPYRDPYAKASSLEYAATDLCSVDKFDEAQEKVRNKEAKGLRKLWKFGRKGHSSGLNECNIDSNSSIDDHMMAISSSGYTSTLKNLISQDETNKVGTQLKVSSPFSILAPFLVRNKKKKAAA